MPCCPNPRYVPLIRDCDGNIRPIRSGETLVIDDVDFLYGLRRVIHVSEAYTVIESSIILADATGGAFTVTLPSPDTGIQVDIKKIDATANGITVDGLGADTIDGSLTMFLPSQYDSMALVADGEKWLII